MTYLAMATLGTVTPATRAKCLELLTHLQKANGATLRTVWGYSVDPANTEHHTGRALDLMTFTARDAGDELADYLWTHRARLRVRHIIWRQRIISTVVAPGVWRAMATRAGGDPTQNHMDHVHVLFDPGPYTPPPAPAPAPTPAPDQAPTPGGFLMALTDAQQTALFNRIMGGIPAGSAEQRTGPDGLPARVLDSADGDYLRVIIEAQTAAIKALAAALGADPATIEATVRAGVTQAMEDLAGRIAGAQS